MRCVVCYTGSGNTVVLKPGSDTKVQASNEIVLEPGFSTEPGALLDATISSTPLNNNTVRLASLATTPVDHSQKNPYADVVYDLTTGSLVSDKALTPQLLIHPNPSESGLVYLSISNYSVEEGVSYEVFNASGQLLSTFEATTIEQLLLEPTTWTSGVYIIKANGMQWTAVGRFVKL